MLFAGCGAQTPSPSAPRAGLESLAAPVAGASGASATSTTPSTQPGPTPDPEVVRKAAAAGYLAVARAHTSAEHKLLKDYKVLRTVKVARTFFRKFALIDGDYIAGVKALVVPADANADLHDLMRKWTALQALHLEGADGTTWADIDGLQGALVNASRRATAADNLFRSDLGLPPIHY